jgi:hypothetical protein
MRLASLKNEENEPREKGKVHLITLLLELISTPPSKKVPNKRVWREVLVKRVVLIKLREVIVVLMKMRLVAR